MSQQPTTTTETSSSSTTTESKNVWVPEKTRKGDLKTNKIFEQYYFDQQRVVDSQEELKDMVDAFRKTLPISFRINQSIPKSSQEKLKQKIRNFAEAISKIRIDDSAVSQYLHEPSKVETEPEYASLKPVPFIPDDLVWQMHDHVTKNLLRKQPEFSEFRNFLMRETEKGNFCRQEVVSMLPPLMFTNWKPSDKVLDMCAAPGSKTSQLVELLYQSSGGDSKNISGFVIANDNDVKRAYLLVHQLQRLNFLFPHLMITNHDATKYPQFTTEPKLKFDKVLCDIMCSGDGTIRKSPQVWRQWKANMGHGLHKLQVDCVLRAFDMLNVGGEIVYSTCTLNPIEDEAVVAEIIRRTKGKLVLQDLSSRYPSLKYKPGMTNWVVTSKKGELLPSFEYARKYNSDNRITESEFAKDDVKDMNMHYTMRILPNQNNTGGFYIAHFKKVADLDEPISEYNENTEETIKQFKGRGIQKDTIQSMEPEKLEKILDFYGVNRDNFKNEQFCLRTTDSATELDSVRKVMYISPSVRKFVEHNMNDGQQFNIINCGIRVFARNKAQFLRCRYRMTQEAATLLWDNTNSHRKIELNRENFIKFLVEPQVSPKIFEENGQKEEAEKISQMEPGGVLVKIKDEDEDSHDNIVVIGFKGNITISRHIKYDQVSIVLKSIGCDIEPKKKKITLEKTTETEEEIEDIEDDE
ncbi:predicted protein [Naegleria gruberi]|uniref:Predicted protein n=1 Tax=Naegleria gruberi TaxID=5762 RepID=D2VP37_NAEGR|nr:uncharacterized protein NAEGRDRAFT_80707 [Naegleria gruberi]EFC41364.1 predicted protein [Naegleria gruberi]|eukprot:XP_002674108.1 predicted protein [Naegleria gruberi strain NEG-M]